MITSNQETVVFNIVQGKSKNSVQIFQKMLLFILIKSQNDFTIGLSKKFVLPFVLFTNFTMIVNFPIHGQHKFSVFTEQRLFPGFRIDNGQAFMRQNGFITRIDARPVRPAMTYRLRHFQ
jgi:hypothetical protein